MENEIPDIPQSSILYRTYKYCFERTKAPAPIIFWSVFALLGATLRDKIYIDWATKTIFPNFPLLIVAPSGWGKTGAVNACMPIFEGVLPYIIPEDSTAESFAREFARYSLKGNFATCALWIVPELADIFGKKKYQEGLIARLTRILDAPKDRKVSRMGAKQEEVIWGRAVFNWISCTTFPWLADNVEASVSTGGFLPRVFTILTNESPRKNTNPQRDHQEERLLNQEIKSILYKIKKGAVPVSKEIEVVLEQNFEDHMKAIGTELENVIARRDENLLRIYLVLSIFGGLTAKNDLLRFSYGSCKYLENNNLVIIKQLNNSKNRNNKFSQKNYDRVLKKFRNSVRQGKSALIYSKICRDLDLHSEELKYITTDLMEKGCVNWDKSFGDTGTIDILENINDF